MITEGDYIIAQATVKAYEDWVYTLLVVRFNATQRPL